MIIPYGINNDIIMPFASLLVWWYNVIVWSNAYVKYHHHSLVQIRAKSRGIYCDEECGIYLWWHAVSQTLEHCPNLHFGKDSISFHSNGREHNSLLVEGGTSLGICCIDHWCKSTEWLQKVQLGKWKDGLNVPCRPVQPFQPFFPFPVINLLQPPAILH